ncbi:uracil-DNA glycosylase family protein [Emcibacteraceae bacterium]|nr:uracil-DNA glycosylase family protein [Emcibacteraceae bacterium]
MKKVHRFFMTDFKKLLSDIRSCEICKDHLPFGPRPVIQMNREAKILIVGQAPGIRVHETGIPFNDPSGDRLRNWLGVNKDLFYDEKNISLLPMGFCYPGTGQSGDLAPRPECAIEWRKKLLFELQKVELTLIIGGYAINWHLKNQKKKTLTETVKSWKEYGDQMMVLPHPSPRNNIWLQKNSWFEAEIIPELRRRVRKILV